MSRITRALNEDTSPSSVALLTYGNAPVSARRSAAQESGVAAFWGGYKISLPISALQDRTDICRSAVPT